MKILRTIALLLLALFATSRADASRTFYIDYAGGSNSNLGTKVSPWKSHPYMPCGPPPIYAHVPGDTFIFKGGVTWPFGCFQMNITAGGSSDSVRDIYTVDQTWFTGGSFTKPKLSGAGAAISILVRVAASNIAMSFLDAGGQSWNGLTGSGDNGTVLATIYVTGGHSNVSCLHCELHDWTLSTPNTRYAHSWTGFGFGSNNNIIEKTIVCQDCYIHDDGNPSGYVGTCFYNISLINSHCYALTEGAVGFADVDGNEINCIGYGESGCPASGWSTLLAGSGVHTNVLEVGGKSYLGAIRNNLIHDTGAGVVVFLCGAMQFYNNVMWNNLPPGGDPPVMYDAAGATAICSSQAAGTTYIANNTIRCDGPGGPCIRLCPHAGGSGSFNINNNHYITNGSPLNNQCTGITLSNTNNVPMTIATATAQNYVLATLFSPQSATGGTIHAGKSLSSACLGNLTQLCSSTSAGNTLTPVPRLIWDAGAYQFGGSSSKPNPPSSLSAVVQ